ncbi:metalloendopeptidase OMA1, mitochondrial-like isoform X2 [Athalia rosae]|nr:metalloendopeptidase OMA1, mitochondrial-like isoform X2 [Athalia rosae]
MFTKQQEAAFAKLIFDAHLEEHKDHILPKDHPIYKRLLKITNRILNANKDLPYVKDKQWTLSVIDNPTKNAYVLPGGNMFIFTGALQMVENEDQLSFIVAHEMAHALLKHSIEQVSNGFIVDLLLVFPIIIIWAIFPDLIAGLLQFLGTSFVKILHDLPYSRALETEADEVGLTLSAKACIDVREAVVFWGMMRTLKDMNSEQDQIPWLSTHPNDEDREKNLNSQMAQAIALRSTYQCPMLNPRDPRKIFYEKSQKELAARLKDSGIL